MPRLDANQLLLEQANTRFIFWLHVMVVVVHIVLDIILEELLVLLMLLIEVGIVLYFLLVFGK